MKFKCSKCGHHNEVNIGSVLGSHTSEAKREAARQNALRPAKPGSRPRGRPALTWTAAQMAAMTKILDEFNGSLARALEKHPGWDKLLLSDRNENAVYRKLYEMKQQPPAMITPPLPPPPSERNRADRRGSRGVGAPKPTSNQ
jgi:hypothetical protein